ncbi:MAG: hypothetical protein ACLUSK_03645 [Bacteroides stercoris]
MSTNYNQLLKDLEIGSVYVKILICFLGCTFMLYPFLCYFTHFFRELSVYEQIFFTLGSSTMYIGIGIPVSCLSGIKYPGMFFLPILILAISASISFFMPQVGWTSISGKDLLLVLLPLEYGLTISFELISIIKENKKHASKP